ncbi:hypothetical protein [[Limnothrix rosea] IAM M-220]|uniref:hypothetical protein n=1 Tax=[Limnothrix rosea] IAM M-220 TaxID=454133 RepID=UPI000960D8AA|nr:hypothetical protein [[Limnothrix rosea] IAM M-220]OKH17517.1 hypothetical protein NIES208_09265 [[Limnothrix rosea] IAM M-220]
MSFAIVEKTNLNKQIVAPNIDDLMSQSLWPSDGYDAQVTYIQNLLVKLESGETMMNTAA